MSNMKVSARPPVKKEGVSLDDLKSAFVQRGNLHSTENIEKVEEKKWELARSDIHKVFNLRLSEVYNLKLDYVSSKIRKSKHSICLDAVQQSIDDMIDLIEKGEYHLL